MLNHSLFRSMRDSLGDHTAGPRFRFGAGGAGRGAIGAPLF